MRTMKKGTKKADILLPPITVGFEEAVKRLLKVKPPAKATRGRKTDGPSSPKKAR